MYCVIDTRHPQGVLIEFDLAASAKRVSDDLGTRGTRTYYPFMALEVLRAIKLERPLRHILRFDLESLVYMFMWHATRYTGGYAMSFPSRKVVLNAWLDNPNDHLSSKSESRNVLGYWAQSIPESYEGVAGASVLPFLPDLAVFLHATHQETANYRGRLNPILAEDFQLWNEWLTADGKLTPETLVAQFQGILDKVNTSNSS